MKKNLMMLNRPRRLRKNQTIRDLCQENWLNSNDLIYPIFVKDGLSSSDEISTMPNIFRYNIEDLLFEIEHVTNLGLKAIALFPVIESNLKTSDAKEAYNPEGLSQRTIRAIKKNFPELLVISDIALDPYTNHGHDGLIEDGKIINDETVEILCKMALVQAEAGADIVAPSDMMDGRVKAIRESLEQNGFEDTLIMSYTAKYASSLYGPFRDALGSLDSQELNQVQESNTITLSETETIPRTKKTYQMNPANSREAIKELELDLNEAADIVMVKPATWYLDIVKQFKDRTNQPIAAYQVSGEYSMIQYAAQAGAIDLDKAIEESLISIKRSGADMILSYFTKYYLAHLD